VIDVFSTNSSSTADMLSIEELMKTMKDFERNHPRSPIDVDVMVLLDEQYRELQRQVDPGPHHDCGMSHFGTTFLGVRIESYPTRFKRDMRVIELIRKKERVGICDD